MANGTEIADRIVIPIREATRSKLGSDEKELTKVWIRMLAKYPLEQLERALEHFLENRSAKDRGFPELPEFLRSVKMFDAKGEARPHAFIARSDESEDDRRWNLVDKCVRERHPMAVRAAQEGWLLQLESHITREGVVPEEVDMQSIKDRHALFLDTVKDALDSPSPTLKGMAQAMLTRACNYANRLGQSDTPAHTELARFNLAARQRAEAARLERERLLAEAAEAQKESAPAMTDGALSDGCDTFEGDAGLTAGL